MADPDNLVLELLRSIRGEIAAMRDVQNEHSLRFAELTSAVAGLRRDQAYDAEVSAHVQVRIDKLREDVDRIKRRLDLVDG